MLEWWDPRHRGRNITGLDLDPLSPGVCKDALVHLWPSRALDETPCCRGLPIPQDLHLHLPLMGAGAVQSLRLGRGHIAL